MAEHDHEWVLQIHLDGCHFFQSSYSCRTCGAARMSFDERDAKPGPDNYSTVWMLPEECERCAELIAGAKPRHSDEIVIPT